MGVTLSGALTPILVGLRNAAKTTKLSSIIDVLNWLKGTKAWTKISEFLVSIKNGISKVVDVVGPSVKYFADLPIFVIIKKMSQGIIGGIQAILSGIGKIFGFINNSIVKPIYTFIENLISKGLQKLGTPEKYAKPLSKGVSGWGTVYTLDKMIGTSTLDDENVQPSQRK
jgi:phage-related minor tail protein